MTALPQSVNLQRVRYLYEAVRFGTLRAAADYLDLAPSAVSRQITLLESELATMFVERHSRGVRLTDEGRMLLEYFKDVQSQQENLLSRLEEVRGLQRGHVNLAVGEGFIGDFMSAPMQQFHQRYPKITLTLDLCGTNEVLRRVIEDEVHLGLVYNPARDPNVQSRAVHRQPICVIAAPKSPLAKLSRPLRIKDLLNYPVALLHQAYGIRQSIQVAEYSEQVRLVPSLTTNSLAVLRQFVQARFGITFLPAFAVLDGIDDGQLIALPLEHATLARAEAHLINRRDRRLPPAASLLAKQLITYMRIFRNSVVNS